MEVKELKKEDRITLEISGRVDATNSNVLQNAILLAFQKMKTVELDFENVQYIASAGLRALMMDKRPRCPKGAQ